MNLIDDALRCIAKYLNLVDRLQFRETCTKLKRIMSWRWNEVESMHKRVLFSKASKQQLTPVSNHLLRETLKYSYVKPKHLTFSNISTRITTSVVFPIGELCTQLDSLDFGPLKICDWRVQNLGLRCHTLKMDQYNREQTYQR